MEAAADLQPVQLDFANEVVDEDMVEREMLARVACAGGEWVQPSRLSKVPVSIPSVGPETVGRTT